MMCKSRCAIYARQSFVPSHRETSLNAQFEPCLKYITSMMLIGWEWIGTRYDDAGYWGATLDRPARTSGSTCLPLLPSSNVS